MRNFKALSAILHGNWLIHKEWAASQMPLVFSMLEGNSIVIPGRHASDNQDNNAGGNSKKVTVICIEAGTISTARYNSFDQAPEGSIALVELLGPVMKYDDECGAIGSSSITEQIKSAAKNPNISGIVLKIDSPGGMVDGTATLADAIKESSKPVVAFIDDGMMASAAYWIGSAAKEIIASQKTDTIGSIGVYTTLADYSEYYKQKGIKVIEVYSDRSKDKNKTYKDALKGEVEGIKEDINFIADQFIEVVKTNRGTKLNVKATTTGKMFTAEEAIELGLIDAIGNFEYAVQRVNELSAQSQSSNNKKDTNMKVTFKGTMTALLSLFSLSVAEGAESVDKEISAADWEKVNAELAEKESLSKKVKELEAAAASAKTASDEAIAAVNKSLSDMTADRDSWKEKAEKFGSQAGAMGTNPKKDKTDDVDDGKKEIAGYNPDAEHNVEARRMLGLEK